MVDTITRKIFFDQITWIDKDGNNVMKDLDFFESILNKKINKPINDGNNCGTLFQKEAHVESPEDTSLWRASKIRMSDLPLKFKTSNPEPEPLGLEKDEGLFEPSHFGIFDGKILVSEFNFHGPRVQSAIRNTINNYLKNNPKIAPDIKEIEINPILTQDSFKRIDKFVEMRGADIKVATNYAKLLKNEDHNSFGEIFSSADLVDNMYLNISYRLGKRKSEDSVSQFKNIKSIFKKIANRNDFSGNVNYMKMEGQFDQNGSPVSINIIESLLKSEAIMKKVDSRTRAINPTDMYQEIMSSYIKHEDLLKEHAQED